MESYMKIGTFQMDQSGTILGRIHGLGLGSVPVSFDPEIGRDNRKYFRLTAEPGNSPYEIGKAFQKEKGGMTYYSVNIEAPFLSTSIHAALFPDRAKAGAYNLVWNKPEQASPKSANSNQHVQRPANPHVS
jgi:uncharacterized protein (DUF736 family)